MDHSNTKSPHDGATPVPQGPSIELHIDELVLDGFAQLDRAQIGDAVQAELSQMLKDGMLAGSINSLEISRLDGGSFTLPSSSATHAVAKEIAAHVYQALRGRIGS